MTSSLLTALEGRMGDRADAVRVGDESTSWEQLLARAHSAGARIAGAQAVATCATASLDTVVAVVSGLVAGVPIVPVPPDAGPIERDHILRDSSAVAVLGEWPWADLTHPLVSLDGRGHVDVRGVDRPHKDRRFERPALIMYTSGTTGLPKGAMLSEHAIAADLDGLADAWGWTPADHLVHGLPLFHVHGLILGVLGALRVGSQLTHTGRPTPSAYAAAKGSLYFGVPTVWSRMCADASVARALGPARLLVSGSAPLPVSVFDRLAAITGHRPIERYGMTETLITLSTRHDGERRAGFVGTPVAGVETRIVADGTADVAVDNDGDSIGGLQVRGSTLFDGYVSGGRSTDRTDDGWFVTGDAATIGHDGFHRIVGRTSIDIIKTGGYKVGAGEIEAVVLDHPGVEEVAVVGLPDDDLGQRVVAFVVPGGDGNAADLAASVSAFVADRLTVHKRPREVRIVDTLPRNAMGKVLKTVLASG